MKNQEQPKLRLLLTKWSANGCGDDEKPELLIDAADYPRAARQIRDLLASDPCIVERGTPMRVVKTEEGAPKLTPLTADQIVLEVHRLCQPVKIARDGRRVPTTLPTRVARMYLAMSGEWNVPPVPGICTAPGLA